MDGDSLKVCLHVFFIKLNIFFVSSEFRVVCLLLTSCYILLHEKKQVAWFRKSTEETEMLPSNYRVIF